MSTRSEMRHVDGIYWHPLQPAGTHACGALPDHCRYGALEGRPQPPMWQPTFRSPWPSVDLPVLVDLACDLADLAQAAGAHHFGEFLARSREELEGLQVLDALADTVLPHDARGAMFALLALGESVVAGGKSAAELLAIMETEVTLDALSDGQLSRLRRKEEARQERASVYQPS